MNEYYYMYTKCRKDFGKHCNFEDLKEQSLADLVPMPQIRETYIEQDPVHFSSDNIPKKSEHEVNTQRVSTRSQGMKHTEGGWPKEVDANEHQETSKWRRKVDKDPNFLDAVKVLTSESLHYLQQNNTIAIFEEYFTDGAVAPTSIENLSTRTLSVFKDQVDDCRRTATRVCWNPDGPQKIAVAYSITRFQKIPDGMPTMSFLWDVTNPNVPVSELAAPSPLQTLQYNAKNPDVLIGGCHNGLICTYDVRKGAQPTEVSKVERSHYDPVYDMAWGQSKTNSEFVSVSTDGRVLWWDTRMSLQEPIDECELTDGNKENPMMLGGVSLEWNLEAGPTKYLVGTEQGVVLSLNKKPKKAVEVQTRFGLESGRHFGPVYSCKRNPANAKYFLTVGDWTAKVWVEEGLKTPIISTSYHDAPLMNGAWSPTRPGLFTVCRQDGYLDFWDIFYRQDQVVHRHKVGDAALWSLSMQSQGQLVAVGDTEGTVSLLELCEPLSVPSSTEKGVIIQIFEREARREKNLETQRKQQEGLRAKKEADEAKKVVENKANKEQQAAEQRREFVNEFFAKIGMEVPPEERQEVTPPPPAEEEKKDEEQKEEEEGKNEDATGGDGEKEEEKKEEEKEEKEEEKKEEPAATETGMFAALGGGTEDEAKKDEEEKKDDPPTDGFFGALAAEDEKKEGDGEEKKDDAPADGGGGFLGAFGGGEEEKTEEKKEGEEGEEKKEEAPADGGGGFLDAFGGGETEGEKKEEEAPPAEGGEGEGEKKEEEAAGGGGFLDAFGGGAPAEGGGDGGEAAKEDGGAAETGEQPAGETAAEEKKDDAGGGGGFFDAFGGTEPNKAEEGGDPPAAADGGGEEAAAEKSEEKPADDGGAADGGGGGGFFDAFGGTDG
uniref:Dynein intermediate chain n=1 Tax=Chromera velia CCMP2878 TaxID=1169474 RepID=A0A0G4FR99_9ALVE|eukprot:Cvel_18251.t1-p1 / transcript=Cvel_18251.t1 / gene=Cvel_18251 / organism=Chromera_velia_CCMP2878 / gene_product=Dynein intermediate chain 2, axonemal, putative / transcript_product=Dynein intermediate chain 2, axonemal, putative / location=Cvel_scaffold1501:35278-45818(+) / protein_length=885 / sequence_SO=supercontig / SO=protein_coding / is_pseudo=false